MTGIQVWFSDFCDLFYKCFIREDRYKLLLDGIGVTIKISLLAVFIGILIVRRHLYGRDSGNAFRYPVDDYLFCNLCDSKSG